MSVRDNYTMINIREYLALGTDEEVGEPALARLLSDFSCPKNPDVEYFLKKNAIDLISDKPLQKTRSHMSWCSY